MKSTFFKKNFELYGEITLKNLELNFVVSCDTDSDDSLRCVEKLKMKKNEKLQPIQSYSNSNSLTTIL